MYRNSVENFKKKSEKFNARFSGIESVDEKIIFSFFQNRQCKNNYKFLKKIQIQNLKNPKMAKKIEKMDGWERSDSEDSAWGDFEARQLSFKNFQF